MILKIDPEFRDLIPPLSADECAQLEANIVRDGCRDALVTWVETPLIDGAFGECKYCDNEVKFEPSPDSGDKWRWVCPECDHAPYMTSSILLDGHHRLTICEAHGIEYETEAVECETRDAAKLWVIENQVGRRNLNNAQKADLAHRYKVLVAAPAAKERQGTRTDIVDNCPQGDGKKSRDIAAEKFGISGKTLDRWEAVLESEDEETIAAARAGDISINKAYDKKKKEERQKKREETKATETRSAKKKAKIHKGDGLEWLATLEDGSVDLLLTDPPYSTDVDDLNVFVGWLPEALKKVSPTGRAYVCVGSYPVELAAYLLVAMPNDVLVWTYRNTMGPAPKTQYKRNWQAVLYYVGAEAPPLDCPELNELFSVQDISAPDGRQGNRYHAWQKPDALAERFIRHATKPGALVADPFAGTGTFLLAAARLGRVGIGCEVDSSTLEIAVKRGCHEF